MYNRREHLRIFKEFQFEEAKTTNFVKALDPNNEGKKTLVISSKPNEKLQLSLRNLKNFNYMLANQLNVREITSANQIIMDELSLQVIKETYCAKK